MRDHLAQGHRKLPIVLPVVLYNGKRKYRYSTVYADYFDDVELASTVMGLSKPE